MKTVFPSIVPGDHSLILRATRFATIAHDGQRRKYSNQPYIVHPLTVARFVSDFTMDPHVISAAVLHDVIEDTSVTYEDLKTLFGFRIADMVLALTNTPVTEGMNRATRKKLDNARILAGGADVHLIKAFDIYDNWPSIRDNDPNFAKVFNCEKQDLIPLLNLDSHVKWLLEELCNEADKRV